MELIKSDEFEILLLDNLIQLSNKNLKYNRLEIRIKKMDDGGMGGFEVFPFGVINKDRCFGSVASEFTSKDSDFVEVIVSLYLDEKDQIFEVDVWKVDFSEVKDFGFILQNVRPGI